MIVGVFLSILIPLASSNSGCSLDTEELVELKQTLESSVENMKGLTDHQEDAAVCLGAARAGKSTLINYLIGNKLSSVCDEYVCTLSKADPTAQGPEIGDSSVSLTKEPSKWTSRMLQNLVIWDTPGFGDNRGVKQDTINSFYIYNLVKSVRSVKFVLVIDFNDFQKENTDSVLTTLNNLENFFGTKFPDFFQSISLIFTKAPTKLNGDSARVDRAYIKYRLENAYLRSDISMSENIKSFLQYLVNHLEQIGIFKKPATEDRITRGLDYNILPAIKQSISQANYTQDIHPSISEKTRNALYACHNHLFEMSSTAHLSEMVFDLFDKETLKYQTKEEIMTRKNNLLATEHNLLNCVQNETRMDEVLSTIKLLDDGLSRNIENNDYFRKFELLQFFDYLLNSNAAEQVKAVFKSVLWKVLREIKDQSYMLEKTINNRTIVEHQRELDQLKKDSLNQITQLTNEIDRLKSQNNGVDLLGGLFENIINSIKSFIAQLVG